MWGDVGPVATWAIRMGAVAGPAAAAWVLADLTGPTLAAATSPHAGLDALLAGAAAVAAWLVVARLAAAGAATALAALPGAAGRCAAVAAAALTPALLRGVLRLALGAAVAGSPALAAPASWADPSGGDGLPVLDRVAAVETPGGSTGDRAAAPPDSAPGPVTVVVRPGDCLWRIAARALPAGHTAADVARSWPRWYAANRAVIGPDPDLIRPGQRLQAPDDGTTTSQGGSDD